MSVNVLAISASPLKDERLFCELYALASERRRKKVDALRFEKDKRLSLAAEFLLMHACEKSGYDYKTLKFSENAFSKPFFLNCPLKFSLSHSEEMALCAAGDTEVGCDTEFVRPVEHSIAERFFAREEAEYLAKIRDENARTDAFFRLWTLKESVIKCAGKGLSMPLDSFCVDISDVFPHIKPESLSYKAAEFEICEGYKCAVCAENKKAKFEFTVLDTDIYESRLNLWK